MQAVIVVQRASLGTSVFQHTSAGALGFFSIKFIVIISLWD